MTDDFLRSRLDGIIYPRHPLAVLGDKLPWSKFEASIAPFLSINPSLLKQIRDLISLVSLSSKKVGMSATKGVLVCRFV